MVGTITNDSGNGTGTVRRRGSGFGTILSTFGIRQSAGSSAENGHLSGDSTISAQPIDIARDGNQAQTSNAMMNGTNGAVNSAPGGGAANAATSNIVSSNILGTTPFDSSEHPTDMAAGFSAPVGGGNTMPGTQLPINLVLGQIETNGNGNNNNSNDLNGHIPLTSPPVHGPMPHNGQSLKNVHHFIYPAVRPASAPLLHLEYANDWAQPEALDDEAVRLRKDKNGLFTLRLTAFIDNSTAGNPGFYFDPIVRTAGPGSQLVIGRYTEKVREAISCIPEPFHPAVFKSKVVSRTHGVFKCDDKGNWFVKDVKSSSGTFLNHQRLSQPATMSKDYLLNDGDILQLGLDFRGGAEEIYRCVKMRVELNKSWRRKANAFNKEAIQKMRDLQKMATGTELEDCSICLSKIKPCQAVFIAPCSHSWHFKCIRQLVSKSYPQFVCPNCRAVCDLEADLDSDEDDDDDEFVDEDIYLPNGPIDNRRTCTSINDEGGSFIPNGNSNNRTTHPPIPELDDDSFGEDDDIQMLN
ncbi:unnamed protein product [Kluyveromyces dobzhanskii CBS 2104]|uniref:RING-type E3 ubiquitin transferase n=1 Tax=Kluyveromyces dobzhanskii CBS 2104 TaxID=1427455 RepID=A0A0A8LDL9_9SACH|nr:unnamed protein product [Kluyveromyces dobzhanskii CBS 2104]